jgi:AraC-like DNA-binding protein
MSQHRSDIALKMHKPAFPLSKYVQHMWSACHSGMPSSRQRVYPNGAMALVIHLTRPTATYFLDDKPHKISVPLLAGPYSRSFHIDPSLSNAVIGILFYAGAARMFFPVAAHELQNSDVSLCELYPNEADRLLNDVCSATSAELQFRQVEQYLCGKLAKAVPIHPAVELAIHQLSGRGMPSVRRIQSETGLSHTRLIQLFREHVGLTPKLFCRVRRFRSVLVQANKGEPVNWAELAVSCGYFDQAHLIRDFRTFAGITPRQFSPALPHPMQAVAESIVS